MNRLSTRVAPVLLFLNACGVQPVLTPRQQDSPAPADAYQQLRRKPSACDRQIRLFDAGAPLPSNYEQLAALSATCSPGAVSICEDKLRERACVLGADAVLLTSNSTGTGTPAGASSQSLISREGKAVRWH